MSCDWNERNPYAWMSTGRRRPLRVECVDDLPSNVEIAHSLERLCRWTGHVPGPVYSVARHCVNVSHMVPPKYALEGLYHDAAECLTGDISTPMKRLLGFMAPSARAVLKDLAASFDFAIARREGLTWPTPPIIKAADDLCARLEAHCVMHETDEEIKDHFGVGWDEWSKEERTMIERAWGSGPLDTDDALKSRIGFWINRKAVGTWLDRLVDLLAVRAEGSK